MTRPLFFLACVLVLLAMAAVCWPQLEPVLASVIAKVSAADDDPDGLPADWESRYDDVVHSLRHRARELFARQVQVRADRIDASRSLDGARETLRVRGDVLDSLAGAIAAGPDAGAPIDWNGRTFSGAAAAREALVRWEGELLENERATAPLADQVKSLREAESALGKARSKLRTRADVLQRERTYRRARLDAAAARQQLRAVTEVSRALAADPSLEELHRVMQLIDRELVVAEAREALEQEADDQGRDGLAAAAAHMDSRRRDAEVEARVARRLERSQD